MWIFSDFRMILGVPWESLWTSFSDFSVIWGAKMEDCVQVHVFSDPWMEMMPDCTGCMCYNLSKTEFLNGFTFSTFSLNKCPGGGFRCPFSDFWYLWVTFFEF